MHTNSFYHHLQSFSRFEDFSSVSNYQTVPNDWIVIITDIQGSTNAIEEGRYRDVNILGVASITALQNILPASHFPFVFGGDGMSALWPANMIQEASEELSALRLLAKEQYGLDLRVGIVPIEDIRRQGADISVGKYELENGQHLAMFSGGGLALADTLIKTNSDYQVPMLEKSNVDLRRLSCRWNPIPARYDEIISVLIQAHPHSKRPPAELYQQFGHELSQILGSITSHNPVHHQEMTQRDLSSLMRTVRKLSPKQWFPIWIHVGLWLLSHIPWVYNGRRFTQYKESLASHSDYWKFDDMLRMVLDCTFEQSQRIEALCEDWQQQGWIVYGIHHTTHALMTCQFDAFEDGKHLHFIDGGDGGYAMAAKGLKKQLKHLNDTPR